jgi:hypothetical protein
VRLVGYLKRKLLATSSANRSERSRPKKQPNTIPSKTTSFVCSTIGRNVAKLLAQRNSDTFQTILVFNLTAVRTSNLAKKV